MFFNSFPANHDNFRLLSVLFMYFDGNIDPDQTASRRSLSRVHSVCFHDKMYIVWSAFEYVHVWDKLKSTQLFSSPEP